MSPRRLLPIALALLALGAVAFAAGCGEKEEPDLSSIPRSGDDQGDIPATIVFTKSGGIAGVSEKLVISAADIVRASYAQGDPLKQISFKTAQLTRTRNAVAAIDFDTLEIPTAPPGADEFTYSLAYGADRVAGSESALGKDPGLDRAIGDLVTMLEDGKPGPAANQAG
jgi:hypothetical protein